MRVNPLLCLCLLLAATAQFSPCKPEQFRILGSAYERTRVVSDFLTPKTILQQSKCFVQKVSEALSEAYLVVHLTKSIACKVYFRLVTQEKVTFAAEKKLLSDESALADNCYRVVELNKENFLYVRWKINQIENHLKDFMDNVYSCVKERSSFFYAMYLTQMPKAIRFSIFELFCRQLGESLGEPDEFHTNLLLKVLHRKGKELMEVIEKALTSNIQGFITGWELNPEKQIARIRLMMMDRLELIERPKKSIIFKMMDVLYPDSMKHLSLLLMNFAHSFRSLASRIEGVDMSIGLAEYPKIDAEVSRIEKLAYRFFAKTGLESITCVARKDPVFAKLSKAQNNIIGCSFVLSPEFYIYEIGYQDKFEECAIRYKVDAFRHIEIVPDGYRTLRPCRTKAMKDYLKKNSGKSGQSNRYWDLAEL